MLPALATMHAGPEDVARLLVLVVDHDERKLLQLGAEFDRMWQDVMKPEPLPAYS